jgi:hypothetical protein
MTQIAGNLTNDAGSISFGLFTGLRVRGGRQQIWLGPVLAGRQVTIWADETFQHVLLERTQLKTPPSRRHRPG